MTDNELLLAISGMLDNKILPINERLTRLESTITRLELIIENDVKRDIRVLAENYLPSATRYEDSVNTMKNIENDIELLKKVVSEHSEKLNHIA